MTARTIAVEPRHLALCSVKAERAEHLTRDETVALMGWCDVQTEDLWNDMSLQEILNVYRVSAEWQTWEDWALEDRAAAHKAWNCAVIDRGNQMAKAA